MIPLYYHTESSALDLAGESTACIFKLAVLKIKLVGLSCGQY